jgi:large subunit ribosomal protein L25
MAHQVVLDVSPRTVKGKANKRLRKQGLLPANIYGHKTDPTPIQVDALTFDHLRRQHDTRNVITLRLANSPEQTVLVRHVQHDPLTGGVLHIDFTRVDARERIESKVPLRFQGNAPGVKMQGGVFLHLVEALAVTCEAADIVEHLDVDISGLTEIDSVLHARDIPLPPNYTLVTDPDEPIAKIAAPRVEEAAPAAEVAPVAPAPAPEAAPTEE